MQTRWQKNDYISHLKQVKHTEVKNYTVSVYKHLGI